MRVHTHKTHDYSKENTPMRITTRLVAATAAALALGSSGAALASANQPEHWRVVCSAKPTPGHGNRPGFVPFDGDSAAAAVQKANETFAHSNTMVRLNCGKPYQI